MCEAGDSRALAAATAHKEREREREREKERRFPCKEQACAQPSRKGFQSLPPPHPSRPLDIPITSHTRARTGERGGPAAAGGRRARVRTPSIGQHWSGSKERQRGLNATTPSWQLAVAVGRQWQDRIGRQDRPLSLAQRKEEPAQQVQVTHFPRHATPIPALPSPHTT